MNSFDENSYEEIINSFDEKSRQKFLYLFSVDNSEKFGMAYILAGRFWARYYNYNCNYDREVRVADGSYGTLQPEDEVFFKHIWLKDDYYIFIFLPIRILEEILK